MLESQKEQIAQELANYLAAHNTSQNKIASASGVSAGYLSQIINRNWNSVPVSGGKTTSIGEQHFRKLQAFLGLSLEVFATKNYQDVQIALHEARTTQGYTIIDGDTGAGKTFAITEYARQNPATVYVVKCANSMTATAMIRRMCEVVGVGLTGPIDERIQAIANKLNREGQALLVLDESETMVKKSRAFGFIKDLYDQVEGRAGIVIAGANGILDKMKVKASYNVESFPQVLRRFGANPVMLSSGIDMADAAEICAAFGITEKRDVNTLVSACPNYGTLFAKLKKLKADQEALADAA
jgi:transcriptional regulator with XRE-family HTH domain